MAGPLDVAARLEMTTEVHDHPMGGRIRQPRPAARFSSTPAEIRRHAPLPGEHNDELLEELGYSADAIAALSR